VLYVKTVVEHATELLTERSDHQHYFVILNVTIKTEICTNIYNYCGNGGREIKSHEVYNSS